MNNKWIGKVLMEWRKKSMFGFDIAVLECFNVWSCESSPSPPSALVSLRL